MKSAPKCVQVLQEKSIQPCNLTVEGAGNVAPERKGHQRDCYEVKGQSE